MGCGARRHILQRRCRTTGAQGGRWPRSEKWFNEWHDDLPQGPEFRCNLYGETSAMCRAGLRVVFHPPSAASISLSMGRISKAGRLERGQDLCRICTRLRSRTDPQTDSTIWRPSVEIEALSRMRGFYTAYFEQRFYHNALNIRVGQQQPMSSFFDTLRPRPVHQAGRSAGPPSRPQSSAPGGRGAALAVPGHPRHGRPSDNHHRLRSGNSTAMRGGLADGDPQLRDNHGLGFASTTRPWIIGRSEWDYDIASARPSARRNLRRGALAAFSDNSTISRFHRAAWSRRPKRNRHRAKLRGTSESSRSWSRRSIDRRQ